MMTAAPYTVDRKVLKRFDQRDNVFGRMMFDPAASFYKQGMYKNVQAILEKAGPGRDRIEFARMLGGWTVYDYFHGAFSREPLGDANNVMEKPALDPYEVTDRAAMSRAVKETAVRYGAALTGITQLDETWLYAKNMDGDAVAVPEECRFAIVMLIPMAPDVIRTSPDFTACTEIALAYSRMAFCISCMAEFIRQLGYRAIPMGNDTALSIPLAIDAGLGELGRNGLLITEAFGPCVRICKVFTDLPLAVDEPKSFGVRKTCMQCRQCADACDAKAISTDKSPSFNTACPSNNPGVQRWAVNHDKCYGFWCENGCDCANCIAACPYTKTDYARDRAKKR